SSIATTVWVRLCASIPRITIRYPPPRRVGTGRRAHLSGGEATLLSSHAGRSRTSEGRQKACCPRRAPTLGANPPDTSQPDTEPTLPGGQGSRDAGLGQTRRRRTRRTAWSGP